MLNRFALVLIIVTGCLCLARPAAAQLNGFNIKGDQGLKTGSQAPPGIYYGAPFYWYGTETVKDGEGRTFSTTGDLDMFLGGPLVSVVTTKKLFGGNVGFTAVLPIANVRVELPRLDNDPASGVSDIYIQPINLGWHATRADAIVGYGFFAPTGRYTAGADDNTGLGMWGHEVVAGTTVFLDENKSWHAATTGALEFHSGKKDSDAQVGTLLTLEGGFGRDFLTGAARVGLAYYAQWKMTDDTLTGLPSVILRDQHRVAAIGPEVSVPIATRQTVYGFLTARYQWEVGARTTTQGDAFNLLVVMPLKPIKVNP
ncbi:MAG TPA: transporter [Vicinamibacterales bacterium]